jgi:hypothetical protein
VDREHVVLDALGVQVEGARALDHFCLRVLTVGGERFFDERGHAVVRLPQISSRITPIVHCASS